MKRTTLSLDPWAVGWAIRVLVLFAFLTAFAVPMGALQIIAAITRDTVSVEDSDGALIIPLTTLESSPPTPVLTPTPHIPRIGIIAGHTGNDAGAVCPDGLQEVDINLGIARRVVALLVQKGWQVDLLEEFDVRLNGYEADALLSIHADSCNVPGKTGFKVARAESGHLSEVGDRLVACISEHYATQTGLEFDPYTITFDMTRYHIFYEIDQTTPAAIIEAGFMLDDRELLTERPDVAARGIADGLICFIGE